jgi:hypothetical protein
VSKTVLVALVDDAVHEGEETFELVRATPTNATLGSPVRHTVHLLDDDPLPSVTLSAAPLSIVEGGGGSTLTAALSAPSAQNVSVSLALAGTSASSDYSIGSTTLLIPAGSTSATTVVSANSDGIREPAETLIVDVMAVTNATEQGLQRVTLTLAERASSGGGGGGGSLGGGFLAALGLLALYRRASARGAHSTGAERESMRADVA